MYFSRVCFQDIPENDAKKNQSLTKLVLLAGAEGLEPSTKVLETHVLPLHHTPTLLAATNEIIARFAGFVNPHSDMFFHLLDVYKIMCA